jgi:hypothetical protein
MRASAVIKDLHGKLGGFRAQYREFETNARIWNDYASQANADHERGRIPGQGHIHMKPLVAAGPSEITIEQLILLQLEAAAAPFTATALRKLCQVRNATLQNALAALVVDGRLRKDRASYVLAR